MIDDFLTSDLHDRLLQVALGVDENFTPSELRRDGAGAYDSDIRNSWHCDGVPDSLKTSFREAISKRQDELFSALGITPFPISRMELELVAHRDGNFFLPHSDTFVGVDRDGLQSDRLMSAVYYFHSQPKGFTGGELALYPFDDSDPVLIEPVDNRLVAFPSFAAHEVKAVSCPGDRFADARFAVNCWLHRARPDGSEVEG